MPSYIHLLSALAALSSVQAAMGPAFSTGPVAPGSFIREATATLVLPPGPQENPGFASLWVGMGTSNGDLIQSIAQNWHSHDWNVFAYTLMKTGPTSQTPIQSPGKFASAGNRVTMHYVYNDVTGNYTQIAYVNGKAVSELSTKDGHALGWGSAVECAANDCGTINAHSWINVKIVMDKPDPNYIHTLGRGPGVTGDLVTSDGGKTWTVAKISIPKVTFSG